MGEMTAELRNVWYPFGLWWYSAKANVWVWACVFVCDKNRFGLSSGGKCKMQRPIFQCNHSVILCRGTTNNNFSVFLLLLYLFFLFVFCFFGGWVKSFCCEMVLLIWFLLKKTFIVQNRWGAVLSVCRLPWVTFPPVFRSSVGQSFKHVSLRVYLSITGQLVSRPGQCFLNFFCSAHL